MATKEYNNDNDKIIPIPISIYVVLLLILLLLLELLSLSQFVTEVSIEEMVAGPIDSIGRIFLVRPPRG